MKTISTAGNTGIPAMLTLETLGFTVSVERTDEGEVFRAIRGTEAYVADDPVAVLGLVKLVEVRGWEWHATDPDLMRVMRQYDLG